MKRSSVIRCLNADIHCIELMGHKLENMENSDEQTVDWMKGYWYGRLVSLTDARNLLQD